MRRKQLAFLLLAAGALAAPSAAPAVTLYDANATVGSVGGFFDVVPAYMQQVTVAGPPGAYEIDKFTLFGLRVNAVTPAAGSAVVFQFYTGADLGAGSADALATATLVDGVVLGLPGSLAIGSYNVASPAGLGINVPSNTFAMEVLFLDPTLTSYDTSFGGRYSTGTPSIGSSTGFVWVDSNLDGVYTGAEQVQSGTPPAPTNIRMVFEGKLVPEPSTLLLGGVGLLGLAIVACRRRS